MRYPVRRKAIVNNRKLYNVSLWIYCKNQSEERLSESTFNSDWLNQWNRVKSWPEATPTIPNIILYTRRNLYLFSLLSISIVSFLSRCASSMQTIPMTISMKQKISSPNLKYSWNELTLLYVTQIYTIPRGSNVINYKFYSRPLILFYCISLFQLICT